MSTTVQSIVVVSMLYAEGEMSKERKKRIWTLGEDEYIKPYPWKLCTMTLLEVMGVIVQTVSPHHSDFWTSQFFGDAGSCQPRFQPSLSGLQNKGILGDERYYTY